VKNLAVSLWMLTGMGWMFIGCCAGGKWRVRLVWLLMTGRHFDWITWSLRSSEEHVEIQTGAT
jgi:hypothetical protein